MSPAKPFYAKAFPLFWRQMKDFSGYGGHATYLWPRWILLRAIGLVYVVIFAGIIDEAGALIGPDGLAPLPELMAQLRATYPGVIEPFVRAPTLFWFSSHPLMPGVLAWSGLLAAVALVLNLWPRMALFTCWLVLLSFARGWIVFSDPLVDWMMLEVTLLCIPFAPAGYRPGLGEHSSPRPVALFMVRWLLFRVMFETGISKLLSGDPHWSDLTAMDVLYETAPCPTLLGYFVHQWPHAWHLAEVGLTFAAEIAAPLIAVFGGRRGRWAAFICWSLFQIGIQLTCNFGWLNTASFALGFLLLDDQMLAVAARRLGLAKLARSAGKIDPARIAAASIGPWRLYSLRAALWTHFALTFVVFWNVAGLPIPGTVAALVNPVRLMFTGFGSVNPYVLYSRLDPMHLVAEFVGSNDGGVTWRPYEFRYFPQALDRMPPFIAPRFPRFEATLQIQIATQKKADSLYASVATRLLEQNPKVIALFKRNPFPDRPPQIVRIPGYHYTFTDRVTQRKSGQFWKREYLGEYIPMMYVAESGKVAQSASSLEQLNVTARHGNPEAQARLGLLHITGEEGVRRDGAEAAKWFRLAAAQGVVDAQFNLSLILSKGDGVPKDPVQALHWCRLAAEQGLPEAQDRLGVLCLQGEGMPRNESEALIWFHVAALSGHAEAAGHREFAIRHMTPAAVMIALSRGQAIFAEIAVRKKTH